MPRRALGAASKGTGSIEETELGTVCRGPSPQPLRAGPGADLAAGTFVGYRRRRRDRPRARRGDRSERGRALEINEGWLERRRRPPHRDIEVEVDARHRASAPGAGATEAARDPGRSTSTFRGVLNDKLVGFYRSTYEGPDGEAEVIATTHFEATDARRAFPCWDEPDLKAVFGVTLIVRRDLTALSNGPEIEREPLEDGTRARPVRGHDARCRRTSSRSSSGTWRSRTRSTPAACRRAWRTCPGKGQLAAFALEVGAHSRCDWFARLLRHPVSRTRRSITSRCRTSPRARWRTSGCITYREAALLVDPATATHGEQLRASPRRSRTSSPTCGSATSSRCAGGTACG